MRLIDADALLEKIDNPYEYNEVARWVKVMPTENPGDCISRQATLDAIADIHNEHLYKQLGARDTYSPYNEGWSDACYRIDAVVSAMPPAQPEIITCEHCSKCQKDDVFLGYWCEGKRVRKDHYCGYAKRRTDEQT